MQIDRRTLLLTGSAALGAAALPRWAHAQITLGDVRIDTLSDGNLVLPRDFQFGDLPQDEVTAILQRHGITGNELNETMRTRLPISGAIEDAPPGLYVMSATPAGAEPRGATAQQWFVLSDIGLSTAAGNDGIHVYTRSLVSAQ